MCLILLGYQVDRRYPLIVAANRDEFYHRPTAPASFWEDAPDLLAGRDLLHGGTWLGVTRKGRLAALTNLRDAGPPRSDPPSRGNLVREFLLCEEPPERYLEGLRRHAGAYSGFQLIAGDRSGLYSYSNSTCSGARIIPGFHGFSNHPVEKPWPKTVRGRSFLAHAVRAGALSEEALFAILSDGAVPSGAAPGDRSGEGETALSPIFMQGASFGTRCSTILLLDNHGVLTFAERTFGGSSPTTVREQFVLSQRP